ncbi:HAMP domain-containing sensor histidine kinase [Bacillus thuringiensis]
MKKGIVFKLFLLTTSLCLFILATIFIGQTLFFKQYYANRKMNDIQMNLQTFEKAYVKAEEDAKAIQKLEENFYQENATWITTLDHVGNIKYAKEYSVDIQLYPNQNEIFSEPVIQVPLYSFGNTEDMQRLQFRFKQGNFIMIHGVQEGGTFIPKGLKIKEGNVVLENKPLSEKGDTSIRKEYTLFGSIKKVQFPESAVGTYSIYGNRVFIDRIKQFQVQLIADPTSNQFTATEIQDYEENDIKYKLLIKATKDEHGKTNYIFAMTSLQPVDEAVQMIKGYYVYLIVFVLLLIVWMSFYYSKKIAKPLLQINDATKKIADLDFSEIIPITTKDEIGDLSKNINTLSQALHSYIHQLQQDIEKEKQLEHTRKEFIAGVSHELKTPLSVMKSCISILEDGVASNKKEYYFQAMSKEVDKMDMLIIDMLELAKFESGTYKMDMNVFPIDETIEYICEQFTSDITAKHLYVEKHLSKVEVVANQHRIEQVITNFITNAIRYTPEQEKIIISIIEENTRVKICVENKGAHIASEHIEKIWDRFYRGDMSRQRSKGGTGLGLAISKNILELHGVEYGVSNTEDGVLFFFYLNKNV